MWMNEFIMKMYDFMGIYNFFGVKIAIRLSKSRCDLIITLGFDFGSNMTVESSYIRWKSN